MISKYPKVVPLEKVEDIVPNIPYYGEIFRSFHATGHYLTVVYSHALDDEGNKYYEEIGTEFSRISDDGDTFYYKFEEFDYMFRLVWED